MKPHKEVIYAGVVILVLLFVIALIVGCSKPKQKTQTVVPMDCPDGMTCAKVCPGQAACVEITPKHELTDKEKIDLLRKEAHKRKLRWWVDCHGTEDKFTGMAYQHNAEYLITDDQPGAKPFWAIGDYDTQADAAYALYKAIQGDPRPVIHVDKTPAQERKICPPELRGE